MATSGTRTYNATALQIITNAFRKVGVLDEYTSLDAQQTTQGGELLEILVKSWSLNGLILWDQFLASVTPVDGTFTYTVLGPSSARPIKIDNIRVRNTTTGMVTPLNVIPRDTFQLLPVSASTGVPVQCAINYGRDTTQILVYPTPNADVAANYVIEVFADYALEDVGATSNNVDIPPEFIRALTYNLAVDLGMEYGMPDSKYRMLLALADRLKTEAMDYNTEGSSLFLGPEFQGGFN